MKLRATVWLLIHVFGWSAFAFAQEGTLAARVDRYLAPFVEGGNFTGAVLIAKGDQVLVSKGYGQANYGLNVANTPQTRFHIASISKPFTAVAILILEERGLLSTSDNLSKYLPDFSHGNEITVLNLLTHTSGIPNVNDMAEYEKAQRFPQSPSSLIALFKDKPLDFAPGTKYSYSNSNYNILAFIIELVGRKSYGEFLRDNIFTPLGLKQTGHDGNAADIVPNSASGYEPRGAAQLENAPYLDWSAKTGNGSLYSTTGDLLTFLRSYAQGKVVKQSTVARVWVEKPGNNFGWFVRKSHGELAAATNGRSPGFTSSAEYYTDKEVTVIVLSNSYSPVAQSPIAEDLAALALGQTVPPPKAIVPVAASVKEWKALEGPYSFGNDFYRPNAKLAFRVENDEPRLDWGNNFKTTLVPVGNNEFMDRQFWARLKMNSDGTGFTYSMSGRDFQVQRISAK